jgi:ADP-dependent NAD(P)H-hydrate dehydratase / NAD(P)H-hydrate epimerase
LIHNILPASRAWALHGAAVTRRIEQRCAAALPAHALMRRAGEAVARLCLALAPHAQLVWVAAGPGNNGGDGLEAALHLQAAGRQVRVTWLGDAAHLPDDAKDALARAQAAGVLINSELPSEADEFDCAIDALLGIGSTRAPAGALARLIQRLNDLHGPVLSIDLPSGLHPDTGQALGVDCVRATHTLSLLTLKPGLFTGSGRDHAGTVWLDSLDSGSDPEPPDAWLHSASAFATEPRAHAGHKGSFGDVAVVGGVTGMRGAAILCARAAHAAGAGRVFIELLVAQPGDGIDMLRPELMFAPGWSGRDAAVLKRSTVVCGCGGGDAVRHVLPRLLSLAPRLVLDADALNAVAADPALLALLRQRRHRQQATVLTPHPLEAARLLACHTHEVQADRLNAVRRLVESTGCVVVLKGSGTVTAALNQVPRINASGNASLASAGTGDVLAGWLGGLWAQAPLSDSPDAVAFDIASRAVAEHGAAAGPVRVGAIRAADLIETLHQRSRGET